MILMEAYKARRMGLISDESLFNSSLGKKFKAYDEFNKWDEEWRNGYYGTDGKFHSYSGNLASKNMIPLVPDTKYHIHVESSASGGMGRICFYDSEGTFASTVVVSGAKSYTFTVPSDVYYMHFDMAGSYGTTYQNNICINISKTEGSPKDGDYVPYHG